MRHPCKYFVVAFQTILLGLVVVIVQPDMPAAKDRVAGPIAAHVQHVYDGDTFFAEVKIWPNQIVRVKVRIRGVDAPEVRSKCIIEKRLAKRARQALIETLHGNNVYLLNVSGGKYYGRVLADVTVNEDINVGTRLLQSGLVRSYTGKKRKPWC